MRKLVAIQFSQSGTIFSNQDFLETAGRIAKKRDCPAQTGTYGHISRTADYLLIILLDFNT